MPILLSSVWIIVGAKSGIPVEGVGLPGHFIIRVKSPAMERIDPFGRGRHISVSKCARMVRQLRNVPWEERYLEPVSNDQILARVLRNLMVCYQREERAFPLYRTARFASLLFPECIEHQMVHARIANALQLGPLAASAYEKILHDFPNTDEAREAREELDNLAAEGNRFH